MLNPFPAVLHLRNLLLLMYSHGNVWFLVFTSREELSAAAAADDDDDGFLKLPNK